MQQGKRWPSRSLAFSGSYSVRSFHSPLYDSHLLNGLRLSRQLSYG